MLTKAFSLAVPYGSVAWRANLLSSEYPFRGASDLFTPTYPLWYQTTYLPVKYTHVCGNRNTMGC